MHKYVPPYRIARFGEPTSPAQVRVAAGRHRGPERGWSSSLPALVKPACAIIIIIIVIIINIIVIVIVIVIYYYYDDDDD